MKILNVINPLWVLGAAGVAFVGWIAYDATQPLTPREPNPSSSDMALDGVTNHVPDSKLLGMIQPGMPQSEVQRLLQTMYAPPGEVSPADLSAGYPTYRVNYRIFLTSPVPNLVKRPEAFTPGPHVVTLVFDARHPGHPLVSISAAPDPDRPRLRKPMPAIIPASSVQY